MPLDSLYPRVRLLSILATACAVLGLVCYWWLPAGAVLSLTGLIIGLIGWVNSAQHRQLSGMLAVVVIFAAAALAIDLLAAAQGWVTVSLIPYR